MEDKNSIKDLFDERIVFEVNLQTKNDLTKIAKSKGFTVANVLRKLVDGYIKKNKLAKK